MTFKKQSAQPPLSDILRGNATWVNAMIAQDSNFFTKLAQSQAPKYLYIGCSDSRLPITLMTGQGPGQIFISRNPGNVVDPNDTNIMSAIEYAVYVLGVREIVVCGHEHCGAVKGAYAGISPDLKHVTKWISPIREVYLQNRKKIDEEPDEAGKLTLVSKLSIQAQCEKLANMEILKNYPDLQIHGVYGHLNTGKLEYLGTISPDSIRSKL